MKARGVLAAIAFAVAFAAPVQATSVKWFCTDMSGDLVQVDLATGHGAIVGPIHFGDYSGSSEWVNRYHTIQDLDFGPDGVLYAVDGDTNTLIRINPSTGAGTAIGPTGYDNLESMGFDPTTGLLWADLGPFEHNDPPEPFGNIDTGTGAGTVRTSINNVDIDILHFDANGTCYAIDANVGWDWVYTLDTVSGQATLLYRFGIVGDCATDPLTGRTVMAVSPLDALYYVDLATGNYSKISDVDFDMGKGLAVMYTPPAIPEPTSALLLLGSVGVALIRRGKG